MKFIWIVATALCLAGPVSAQSLRVEDRAEDYQFADRASLDRRIEQSFLEYGIVGGAVAAARDDRVLYARGVGYADREKSIEATIDTPFAMASVTKFLTAAAIMMLVDEGKLDLDAPVNDYLGPDAIRATYGTANAITLGRVMSHTAGLPFIYEPIYAHEARKRPTFSQLMRDHGYTVLPPGLASDYSNLGYEVLAEVVRRVSGQTYEDFIRTRIFEPIGMKTASIVTQRARPEAAAQRYMSNGTIVPGVETSHPGAANAYMSVADMIRMGRWYLSAYRGESELLSRESARMIVTNDKGEFGKAPAHGLWPEDYPDDTLYVSHGGSMAGAKTRFALLPERNLVIAVAINESNATAEAVLGEEMIRSFETQSNLYWRDAAAPDVLKGRWEGEMGGNEKLADIVLDFTDPSDPKATVNGQDVLVRSVEGEGPYSVRLDARLDTDGFDHPHDLRLRVWEVDGSLLGQVKQRAFLTRGRENPAKGFWVRFRKTA